jgi:nucleoside 2-deoxyribosyltransferase
MKIYFAGSIRGGRNDAAVYEDLIAYLQSFAEVLTEHVGDRHLTPSGDDGPNDGFIHDRDMAWLLTCDRVVAEVSTPSLGVGYELGWACALKKPVLCLYRTGAKHRLSAMIAGSEKIQTSAYDSLQEARTLIDGFMAKTAAKAAGCI